MVIVVRSDSYFGDYLNDESRERLVNLIVAAKTGNAKPNPKLEPLSSEQPQWKQKTVSAEGLNLFVGSYAFPAPTPANINTNFTIKNLDGGLVIDGLHYAYRFRLLPLDDKIFFVEDINLELSFDFDKNGRPINPRIRKSD